MTYDPAYMNTAACRSAITYIDGDNGILRYRGYPIEELAERKSFAEVAYLLLQGELPTADQLAEWKGQVTHHTMVHENIKKFIDGFQYDAHPMGILQTTVAALSTFYPDAKNIGDPECRKLQILRLIGKVPTLSAYAYRHRMGLPYVPPDNDLSYTGNFLNLLFKMAEPKYAPNPVLEKALDILFILHADHEQNCSTTAMRGIGSSHVDPYSALAGATAALWGPLHGGANEAVLRMLTEIKTTANIPGFIEKVKKGEGRLMGFGHRIYKNYDPRAKILKEMADRVFAVTGHQPDARHRDRAGADRAARRVLRPAQALSERRLLLGDHLPGDEVPGGHVPSAVRHPAHRGLAGAVGGDAHGSGAEDRAASPDLHRALGAAPAGVPGGRGRREGVDPMLTSVGVWHSPSAFARSVSADWP